MIFITGRAKNRKMLIPYGIFFSFFFFFLRARETWRFSFEGLRPERFEQFGFDSFREFRHGSMIFTEYGELIDLHSLILSGSSEHLAYNAENGMSISF